MTDKIGRKYLSLNDEQIEKRQNHVVVREREVMNSPVK